MWVQSVPLAVRRSGAIFQKQAGGRRWALPTATEQIRASRDCLIYLEFMLGCGGGELLTTTLPTGGFQVWKRKKQIGQPIKTNRKVDRQRTKKESFQVDERRDLFCWSFKCPTRLYITFSVVLFQPTNQPPPPIHDLFQHGAAVSIILGGGVALNESERRATQQQKSLKIERCCTNGMCR